MAAESVGAERRDQRDVRGTVIYGLTTGMGRKSHHPCKAGKCSFGEKQLSGLR